MNSLKRSRWRPSAATALLAGHRSGAGPLLRLTLDDAVARGLDGEPSARRAQARGRRRAAAAVQGRQAAKLPQVAAQAGYTRTNHVDEFGIAVAGGPLQRHLPGHSGQLPDAPRSPVADLHRSAALDALERAAQRRGRRDRRSTSHGRANDLQARDHARVLGAASPPREAVRVVDESLDADGRARCADVRNRLKVGLVPPNDVLSAEAQRVAAADAADPGAQRARAGAGRAARG